MNDFTTNIQSNSPEALKGGHTPPGAYELGVIGQKVLGDEGGMVDIMSVGPSEFFFGLGVTSGDGTVVRSMVESYLNDGGFTIVHSDMVAGDRGFCAMVTYEAPAETAEPTAEVAPVE